MAQLWGGRFTKETDQLVYRFNASISFDQKFYKQDIQGSMAHVKMLTKQGILTEDEKEQILKGLSDNGRRLAEGMRNFGIRLIVTSPFWITAVIIGAVVGCLVWKIRKKFRKRKSGKMKTKTGGETDAAIPLGERQEPAQDTETETTEPDQRKI